MNRSELEKTIIGQITLDQENGLYALDKLTPQHFQTNSFKALFGRLQDISKSGKEITLFTVGEQYEPQLLDIGTQIVSTVGSRTHVNELMELEGKRRFKHDLSNLISRDISTKQILEELEPQIIALSELNTGRGLMPYKEVIPELIQEIEKVQNGASVAIKTGIDCLDTKGQIFRNGELSFVTAWPSVGKTAFLSQVASMCGVNTAFFSMEMSRKQVVKRELTRVTGLQYSDMIEAANQAKLLDGMTLLQNGNVWVDDSTDLSANDIYRKSMHFASIRDLGFIVVDYLQLLNFGREQNLHRQVSIAAKTLKQIAKKLNVPVAVICALKDNGDQSKCPTKGDLKESGDLKYHADVVLILHRKNNFEQNTLLLKDKDRNGPLWKKELKFVPETTSFEEWTDYDRQEQERNNFTAGTPQGDI